MDKYPSLVSGFKYDFTVANDKLSNAKRAKNDEFYTQYQDIEKEINAYLEFDPEVFKDKTILLPCDDPEWSNFTKYFAQNFEKLGLKKLISTSYAPNSKPPEVVSQPTLFEIESPQYDEVKSASNGKIFTLFRDKTGDRHINFEDLEWDYLKGDGDFRSPEITALRNEADMVITNPPFSLFREFLAWIAEGRNKFMLIGNINCITYKEVFPLIMQNKAWLGNGMGRWISGFIVPESYSLHGTEARLEEGVRIVATNNALWLTNIDHGRRHNPLPLMTMADNKKFSKHKEVKDVGFLKYDNYDAIEVPYTDAIPSDYDGIMGVPISFLDKYNPEQFEIVGCSYEYGRPSFWPAGTKMSPSINGTNIYKRIFIRHSKGSK